MVAADGEKKRTGIGYANSFYIIHGRSVMRAQMLEVFLLGLGTVLSLERDDAWSSVKND